MDWENNREITVGQLTRHLSKRMRRLCREVLLRLPSDWDKYRTVAFEESLERTSPTPGKIGYAFAQRVEVGARFQDNQIPEHERKQHWVVTLYLLHLDLLSDNAVKYVIAHELGHVASGLQTDGLVVGVEPGSQVSRGQDLPAPQRDGHEDAVDPLTTPWGFSDELQQFLSETGSQLMP